MTALTYKRHVVTDMDETQVQRCVLCGQVISDYRGAMVPDGMQMPKGFASGDVYVREGNPRMTQTDAPESFINCI